MIKVGICDEDKRFAMELYGYLLKGLSERISYYEDVKCLFYKDPAELQRGLLSAEADVYFIEVEYLFEVEKLRNGESRKNVGIVYMSDDEELIMNLKKLSPLGVIRKQSVKSDIVTVLPLILRYLDISKGTVDFQNGKETITYELKRLKMIVSRNHNIQLYMTDGGSTELRGRIADVMEKLCGHGFIQIDRSCIVNLEHIIAIRECEIELSDNTKVYSSRSRLDRTKNEWKKYIEEKLRRN